KDEAEGRGPALLPACTAVESESVPGRLGQIMHPDQLEVAGPPRTAAIARPLAGMGGPGIEGPPCALQPLRPVPARLDEAQDVVELEHGGRRGATAPGPAVRAARRARACGSSPGAAAGPASPG